MSFVLISEYYILKQLSFKIMYKDNKQLLLTSSVGE